VEIFEANMFPIRNKIKTAPRMSFIVLLLKYIDLLF